MSGDVSIGLQFKMGNGGAPESFAALAKVTDFTFPAISRDSIDVTHQESPDGFREFIPGFADAGDVQLGLNYLVNSSTTAVLNAEFAARTVRNYLIVWPSGASLAFSGFCTEFAPEGALGEKQSASATWKVSGKPVLTQV
jgi:predicted secreted protein